MKSIKRDLGIYVVLTRSNGTMDHILQNTTKRTGKNLGYVYFNVFHRYTRECFLHNVSGPDPVERMEDHLYRSIDSLTDTLTRSLES